MMCNPPLIKYNSINEYRAHYVNNYCNQQIFTFDGIRVYFKQNSFDHAFFESSCRNGIKDTQLSQIRAERIDWIKATLEHKHVKILQGWDSQSKLYCPNKRVNYIYEQFIVVIYISLDKNNRLKGNFITCYQADSSISKILRSPEWTKEEFMKTNDG